MSSPRFQFSKTPINALKPMGTNLTGRFLAYEDLLKLWRLFWIREVWAEFCKWRKGIFFQQFYIGFIIRLLWEFSETLNHCLYKCNGYWRFFRPESKKNPRGPSLHTETGIQTWLIVWLSDSNLLPVWHCGKFWGYRDGKHNLCFLEASSIIKKTGTEDEKKIVCYRL